MPKAKLANKSMAISTVNAREARELAEQCHPDARDFERLLLYCGMEIRESAFKGYFQKEIILNCDEPMLDLVIAALTAQDFRTKKDEKKLPAAKDTIFPRAFTVTW